MEYKIVGQFKMADQDQAILLLKFGFFFSPFFALSVIIAYILWLLWLKVFAKIQDGSFKKTISDAILDFFLNIRNFYMITMQKRELYSDFDPPSWIDQPFVRSCCYLK
jgi:hypothetical protein